MFAAPFANIWKRGSRSFTFARAEGYFADKAAVKVFRRNVRFVHFATEATNTEDGKLLFPGDAKGNWHGSESGRLREDDTMK